MPQDEPTPRRALSPEEVGARVSAILEAAERDARAVIDAAHRAAATATEELTLERLAAQIDELSARVGALESALAAGRPDASPVAAAEQPPAAPSAPPAPPDTVSAVRVRVIELALAGYPRAAIARELAAVMAPAQVDAILDEVLAP